MTMFHSTHDANTATVGWYGKLPAAGDFVQRRLPHDLIAWWDKWLQHGLATLRGDPFAARAFASAPIWNFAVPARLGSGLVLLGAIGPSHDRVGRHYPLCAVSFLHPDDYDPAVLAQSGDYYRQLGTAIVGAVRHGRDLEQLDQALQQTQLPCLTPPPAPAHTSEAPAAWSAGSDIMSILNAGLPIASDPIAPAAPIAPTGPAWTELADCFNPGSHTSYWWTNQADGAALHTYVHGGALNATLFGKLFSSFAALRR